jgi:dynein heavy chain
MSSLEGLIERLVDPNSDLQVKSNFRLFLTSMPASYFPVSVLQNGIKLTTEPPRGLKANLKRSYNEFTQTFASSDSVVKSKEFRSLLFSISFFHANI